MLLEEVGLLDEVEDGLEEEVTLDEGLVDEVKADGVSEAAGSEELSSLEEASSLEAGAEETA